MAMTLVCHKNGAESKIFTDGKVYDAEPVNDTVYMIRDDRGHTRFVIPDEPSAHLRAADGIGLDRWFGGAPVGVFETIWVNEGEKPWTR